MLILLTTVAKYRPLGIHYPWLSDSRIVFPWFFRSAVFLVHWPRWSHLKGIRPAVWLCLQGTCYTLTKRESDPSGSYRSSFAKLLISFAICSIDKAVLVTPSIQSVHAVWPSLVPFWFGAAENEQCFFPFQYSHIFWTKTYEVAVKYLFLKVSGLEAWSNFESFGFNFSHQAWFLHALVKYF